MDTFPRCLLHHAQSRPERPAIREKSRGIWKTLTWRQLGDEVTALAAGLAAQGLAGSKAQLDAELARGSGTDPQRFSSPLAPPGLSAGSCTRMGR